MAQLRAIPAAVEAVLAGDDARFCEIVRAFDALVRRIVARTCRDAHAAEDVVQEVWIRVYRQLRALLEVRAADAWVSRIARNCAHDHARRRRRTLRLIRDQALPEADPAPAGDPGSKSWIADLVETLPPAQRELLTWRYGEGLGYAEIAARLGVPVSTVRGRLYETRLQVRRLIEQRRTR